MDEVNTAAESSPTSLFDLRNLVQKLQDASERLDEATRAREAANTAYAAAMEAVTTAACAYRFSDGTPLLLNKDYVLRDVWSRIVLLRLGIGPSVIVRQLDLL